MKLCALHRVGLVTCIALGLAVAGCSSDAKPKAVAPTTNGVDDVTTSSLATTTTAKVHDTTSSSADVTTTTPSFSPPTTNSNTPTAPTTAAPITGGCLANDTVLADALVAYAKASQPTVPVKVSAIRHATADSAWARASVTPDNADGLDGFIALAHCVGSQWKVIDVGTSGVGCSAQVPAAVKSELGVEC